MLQRLQRDYESRITPPVMMDQAVADYLEKRYGRTKLSKAFLDELFGVRLPASFHNKTDVEIPLPTPAAVQIGANEGANENPLTAALGALTPIPMDKVDPKAMAAAASSYGASTDEDESDIPDMPEDLAPNPDIAEMLFLITKKRGDGKERQRTTRQQAWLQAYLSSLPKDESPTNPNRRASRYETVKQIGNAQQRANRARMLHVKMQNPIAPVTLAKRHQLEIPKPVTRRAWWSNLVAPASQNGPAAAKQGKAPPAPSIRALISGLVVLAPTPKPSRMRGAPDNPNAPDGWHFAAADKVKKHGWPGPA